MGNKVLYAVTIPDSLVFLQGQLKHLTSQGYEVKAMCSSGEGIKAFKEVEDVDVRILEMEREISLFKDAKSLLKCIQIIRQEKPDIINASTPKASLIVMLAAYMCNVPTRIYTMRGLRLETTNGLKRGILLAAEKLAAGAATHCLAVSGSLKNQVVKLGIANEKKVSILGKGSGDGFNLGKFQQSNELMEKIRIKRREYKLTSDHIVLGFVGRLTKDKGIEELVEAFVKLQAKYSNLRLLIVGGYEEGDTVNELTKRQIQENKNIIHAGYQNDPIPFYHLMDVFVFLTKREGFGNVSIEASLSGLPVVAADVTGAKDTLLDGKTGFLVEPTNKKDITEKLELLILAPELRKQMGINGQKWASKHFSNEVLWTELDQFYRNALPAKGGQALEAK
ncbi:glycosyl transferase family 4 [Planomicrobium soli]|uniref:Glycosyl transferase family 4 n=1 Tax=Planomicrobium soli TaxID=1176648 RepID=A0A2P8H3K2_9BACL|nr:glycosyltransferase family 4 protein [Planomicrobium soli]PSL40792.1 glycosyl transferase family 4 [Planomicrobium soli]